MHWLLFLAIISMSVLGAPATSPPTCAQPCLDSAANNISRGGCTARDTACLCSSNPYSLQVTRCIGNTCRDATNRTLGLNYFAEVCAEATAEAAATRTTTITLTQPPALSTNSVPRSTSIAPVTSFPETTSSSSLDSLQTATSTPTPTFIVFTTEALAPSSNRSSSALVGNPTDQGNDQQRNAIVGVLVGAAALVATIIIILLLYRRRKNKKAEEKAIRHLQFVGEEVGSPSAAVHPWRATQLTFTSVSHPNASDHPAKSHSVTEELPKYEGPLPIIPVPEKYAPPRASAMSSVPAPPRHPLARPRQPGPWHQQELSHPVDEYHDIGSNFLRDA